MVERDGAKGVTYTSGCTSDWWTYCKFKNDVTKLNKKKKTFYYEDKINDINNDRKKLELIKLWAERQIQLHLSSNQIAYS